MDARAQIVAEARDWIGTPFHHQASTKGVGADCIGLVVGSCSPLGFADGWLGEAGRKYHGYGVHPASDNLLAACEELLVGISIATATLADILLFTFARRPTHFGIVSAVSPLAIVHAYSPMGRVVEMPIDGKWMKRIHSAYRFRGL